MNYMTRDEIICFLKDNPQNEKIKNLIIVVPNPDYNPVEFSQEIEDSEEKEMKFWKQVCEEMNKTGFDIIWNNTLNKIPRNSEKWKNNHSKICDQTCVSLSVMAKCNDNDIWDFYSEENVDRIMQISEQYGGIIRIL